jgi:hypothetical protein
MPFLQKIRSWFVMCAYYPCHVVGSYFVRMFPAHVVHYFYSLINVAVNYTKLLLSCSAQTALIY